MIPRSGSMSRHDHPLPPVWRRFSGALLGVALVLPGCGGGGGGGGPVVIAPTPTPTPTAGNSSCTLRARQEWAMAQLQEWYLFPDKLAGGLDPSYYDSLQDYVDSVVFAARVQGWDRYFTYVASIAEEDAYYDSGETAGLGVRLKVDAEAGQLFVSEAFEGAPGLAAGLDRGTEILAIGANADSLQTVGSILSNSGEDGIFSALGPSTVGTSRALRVRDSDGSERVVTVTKADYEITPVSARYGWRVIEDGDRRIGYINLRTFIYSAEAPLKEAFASFRAQGIDELIVDLRYNGGGLISVAELLGNLLGGNRATSDVITQLSFRPDKSAENETINFAPLPESVSPRKIAFIGFEGTASASELVINAMVPYLHAQVALIGGDTYGKPVGQIAVDRPACDDRLRIVAFSARNAAGQGNYYTGLAEVMEVTCRGRDDVERPLGDPREGSIAAALDYLAGRDCTPIDGLASGIRAQSAAASTARLLVPDRPTPAQRDVPGLF